MKKFRVLFLILTVSAAAIWAGPADGSDLGSYSEGAAVLLSDTPDYEWWYGCSPTSAGMLMGYYDLNGYAGLSYDNLVPGGDAELTSYGGNPSTVAPLATSIIASSGHIADFYSGGYNASGDDVTTSVHSFNSLADFMGTSQDSVGNTNGSTTFYYFTNGAAFTAQDAYNLGVWNSDGMYGLAEYAAYCGYGYDDLFTQATDNLGLTYGFTFEDYMSYIDSGACVIIHVEGHSMLGYGYDSASQLVYLNDTWTSDLHTMLWGGSYFDMELWGVTVFTPSGGSAAVPLPGAIWLLGSGLLGLAGYRRKLQQG